jgi:hypothetical protein
MRDCREKWRICEGNREFILETLELIKCIFVILLKVGTGQVGLIGWGGSGWCQYPLQPHLGDRGKSLAPSPPRHLYGAGKIRAVWGGSVQNCHPYQTMHNMA